MNHEAFKTLLHTPLPSEKLTGWGMAIQELNQKIMHRSSKHNVDTDALSHSPLALIDDASTISADGVVAAVIPDDLGDLSALQKCDPELASNWT